MTNLDFVKEKMKLKIDGMNAHQIAGIAEYVIGFPTLCGCCDWPQVCEDCSKEVEKWLKKECDEHSEELHELGFLISEGFMND